ncbi:hypothetical protein [Acinetobacter guillouiae]|uniref:hypothetical protein n=1 Tax=Acinetobacter guillouiae TaxID=106649 RepID=UPI0026E15C23|nr:hypothetical protein [Acinetobacter guillouiae]MDO6644561.1 hypothetical protein [Acinetobacter guillouiae]
MNAVEFVKDQGWENAKLVLELIPTSVVEIPDNELGKTYNFEKSELIFLIESIRIVESCGGLKAAIKKSNDMCEAINQVPWRSSMEKESDRLKQAIRDVESVGGGV